jgi:peroxiredoxin
LPDTNGKTVSSVDFRDKPALLVLFICNYCPYVKHIRAAAQLRFSLYIANRKA